MSKIIPDTQPIIFSGYPLPENFLPDNQITQPSLPDTRITRRVKRVSDIFDSPNGS